jgi:hypothetical protein
MFRLGQRPERREMTSDLGSGHFEERFRRPDHQWTNDTTAKNL